MRTLTLIRHAKSDWGHEALKDIDRPLSQRGYEDAYILGKWLSGHFKTPELIMTSPATRNLSTAFIFARALDYPQDQLRVNPSIYECSEKTLLTCITQLDDAYSDIIVFAHNPAITGACNHLSEALDFENIPTCGIVRFEFDAGSWKQAGSVKGKVISHRFSKNFKQD